MIDLNLLLPKLLRSNPELAVKLAWTRAAGAGLRRLAVPFRLEHKTLVVCVADAIWQRQLQSMSGEMIFRMNNLLGQKIVDAIAFRIDAVMAGYAAPVVNSAKHEPAPAPTEVLFAAGSIDDPDLRARFIRAAENCIARRDALNTAE
jgi:hypothetical protein